MEYIRRVVDDEIDRKTEAFNAVSIIGPKGCGKTRTAKERCKTVIEFQDVAQSQQRFRTQVFRTYMLM